jgi:hypothetical protein
VIVVQHTRVQPTAAGQGSEQHTAQHSMSEQQTQQMLRLLHGKLSVMVAVVGANRTNKEQKREGALCCTCACPCQGRRC